MLPGGVERDANVAFRLGPATEMPEAVRPDQARAVRTDEREQPLLAVDAVASRLREPGRDDDERVDPVRERLLGGFDHARSGHADDRHVHRVGDLVHRAVAPDARDR